jgi:hypothetical protein
MPRVGFEATIIVFERVKVFRALNRATTDRLLKIPRHKNNFVTAY